MATSGGMMLVLLTVSVLCAAGLSTRGAAEPVAMPVGLILEERFGDDQLAVFDPERLEFTCETSPTSPWGFAFAGFETKWNGPIEFEVSGSGGYTAHDVFSICALSLDYGTKGGWAERSFYGLGLIQPVRGPHPPSWGVGSDGKFLMRGDVAQAGPKSLRVTLDPAKHAPSDWDGRLWIGLVLHNTGTDKSVTARIVNALPPAEKQGPELDRSAKMELVRKHQRAYIEWRAERTREGARELAAMKSAPVALLMKPYAATAMALTPLSAADTKKDLAASIEKPIPAQRFMEIVSGDYDPNRKLLLVGQRKKDTAELLNGKLKEWQDGGRFGSQIGCIIRAASSLEKVGLSDISTGRIISEKSAPVAISAARHEYEGFQIILTPLPGCAKNVKLHASAFVGEKTSIAADVTINPVGYIRAFQGTPNEMLCADPLLLGDVPELTPGENQPVWITLHVPDHAPAGTYKGSIDIRSEGRQPLSVPVTLRVWDFDIPKKISLRSSFWMFRDQINRFYHLDEVAFDDYMKWIDMALEHRLCPIDVYEGRCTQLLDVTKKISDDEVISNPNPDFTLWDKYIDRMIAGGANTIHLGQSHHQGTFFADKKNPNASEGQVKRVIENLKMLRQHYKDKGVFDLHYMQLRDETSAPESLNVYREVGKALPDVKLLLTAPSAEARPLLNVPCPLTPGFDPAWRDEVKAKGGEYWWYVCCAPSDPVWANLFLHQSAAQHRALFWQTWRNEVEGLLYWGLNFWTWYEYQWPEGVRGPSERVQPKETSNYCPVPATPGDGFSMYPGPSPSQPLSSIRLENMRDGEEDYEYLLLLDRLIAEAESQNKQSPALAKARQARAAARKLVPGLTDYEKTGAPYLAVRQRIGDAIEELVNE